MNDISIHTEEDRSFSATAFIDNEEDDDKDWASINLEVRLGPDSDGSLEMAIDVLDRVYMEIRTELVTSRNGGVGV